MIKEKGLADGRALASRYPAYASASSKLSGSEAWAEELSRWYESDWQRAVEGSDRPFAEKVLQSLDVARRRVAQPLLASIDSYYEAILVERSRERDDNDPQATVELPGPRQDRAAARGGAGSVSPSSPTDGGRHAVTLGEATAAWDAEAIRQANPQTLDFRADVDSAGSGRDQVSGRRESNSTGAADGLPAIPGYVIQGILGRGGMGVVYFAKQIGIDRPVALKMVLSGIHASHTLLDRFLAEAKAVGRLQHENIVRIYEIGWHQDLPYFSLEYVDGPPLSQKLRGEPIDPLQAARLVAPLAGALQYAHDAGIIHRDIKPANVLLTATDVPKLADFGLAKRLEEDSELSRTGDILGTPAYMAPEQARGERNITAAADIYGLGGVLYCALTGRAPFTGTKSVDTIMQLLENEPVWPSRLQPLVPKDLETICLKCLQKDPAQRYPTARDLQADLLRFIEGEPIAARPVGISERVYRWSRRKPRIAALVATATFFALILMIGGPLVASIIYAQKQAVVDSKQLAERKTIQATNSAQLAAVKEAEAKANARAALVQEKNALDALKSLVFEVQRAMRDKPGLQDTRLTLLGVARDGLVRMDGTTQLNQTASIEAAGICRRLGDLNMELGRVQAARDLYEQCLVNLQQLERQGELPEYGYRHNFSTAYELISAACRRLGRLSEARKYGELCLEQRRLWAEEEPDNEDVRQNLAATLGQLGILAQDQGDMEKARELLSESAQMRRQYVTLRSGDVGPLSEWLGARRALAKHAFQEGKIGEATAAMFQIIDEQRELAERFPYDVSYRGNLALFLSDLATFHLYTVDSVAAMDAYQQAVTIQRTLIKEDPKNFSLKEHLTSSLYGLSLAQANTGDEPAAATALAECLELRNAARELDPTNLSRQILWLLTTARSGEIEEAIPVAEQLKPQIETDAGMYFNLGCVYSLFFAAAKMGADLPADTTADHLAQESFDLIRKSYELGFRRSTDLKHDPDLAALRELPDYQSFVADLQ